MDDITSILETAVEVARGNSDGKVAAYIPELASFPEEHTSIAMLDTKGEWYQAGDDANQKFTLQSVSKLIILIGMLEEKGPQQVFHWVRNEPSGDDFASLARLDQFGPFPSNPMLNAGAISLCGRIAGELETRFAWIDKWIETCFTKKLTIDAKVFGSEKRTGDRNRALAYLMKSTGVLEGDVETILESYFYLCSFEVTIVQLAQFALILANQGCDQHGTRIISESTTQIANAIMTTCGLYNESGRHLVRTGMPAKSGVSGILIAIAPNRCGIAVASPRVNRKGNSIRGERMLEYVSEHMRLHFCA